MAGMTTSEVVALLLDMCETEWECEIELDEYMEGRLNANVGCISKNMEFPDREQWGEDLIRALATGAEDEVPQWLKDSVHYTNLDKALTELWESVGDEEDE